MAYNIQKINPLDLQPRKAVGVSIPFDGRAVFHSTYTSKDAVKANLVNFFLTGKNERVFNVNFGGGVRNFLFENIQQGEIEKARAQTLENLAVFFPTVDVQDLQLLATPDSNLITFSLKYSVRDTNIQDEVIINFEQ